MKIDIPRSGGHNPPDLDPVTPVGVTWWALISPTEAPLAVGRTPLEAETRLLAMLLEIYRHDVDPQPEDPEARAAEQLARYKRGALLSGSALDEVGAFLAWMQVSRLTAPEAVRRWRHAFPAPVGRPDALAGLAARAAREPPSGG